MVIQALSAGLPGGMFAGELRRPRTARASAQERIGGETGDAGSLGEIKAFPAAQEQDARAWIAS